GGGGRRVASCGGGSYPFAPGGRDPALQALRPGCEELAARIRKATAHRCRTAGAEGDGSVAPGAQNRHGGAPRGERPAHGTQGASQAPGVPRYVHAPREFRRPPERFSALRPPLCPGERSNDANPGRAENASREREWLFEK